MAGQTAKSYYVRDSWDVKSWVDVVAIDYEKLCAEFPFNEVLQTLSTNNEIRLLDVGCGTAIFPGYVDQLLAPDIKLVCDLLDISEASLGEARRVLSRLAHFDVRESYQGLIEEIPRIFKGHKQTYDLIWSIHSFTTVDIQRMLNVYSYLLGMLAEAGLLMIYQLARSSTYQVLHGYYRKMHVNGKAVQAYMEFEDSVQILDRLGADYSVMPYTFSHRIDESRQDLLEKYLKKVILDDGVQVMEFFSPILPQFYVPEEKKYEFPQTVDLLLIRK